MGSLALGIVSVLRANLTYPASLELERDQELSPLLPYGDEDTRPVACFI